jgi:hypothetical protein
MGSDDDELLRESNPNASGPERAAGGMGVSSEREGHTGPGQHATDGTRDTAPLDEPPEGETPPEQSPGSVEENPEGITPKAGYPSLDPRSG